MATKVLAKKGDIQLLHYRKCKYHDGFYSVEKSNKNVGISLKITNDRKAAEKYFDKVTTKSKKTKN